MEPANPILDRVSWYLASRGSWQADLSGFCNFYEAAFLFLDEVPIILFMYCIQLPRMFFWGSIMRKYFQLL